MEEDLAAVGEVELDVAEVQVLGGFGGAVSVRVVCYCLRRFR